VPPYDELVFVASQKTVEEKGDQIRGFLGALARGVNDLNDDPKKGLDALLAANRDLDPKLQSEVLKVTLPLYAAPRGQAFGYQDPREWATFGEFMRRSGLIQRGARGAFTNDLLPGGGL
jgi:putative hydroxymethylpyrimidine transport system substrate-binding protein